MRTPPPAIAHGARGSAAPRRSSVVVVPRPPACGVVRCAALCLLLCCSRPHMTSCSCSDQPQFPLPGRRQLRPIRGRTGAATGGVSGHQERPPSNSRSASDDMFTECDHANQTGAVHQSPICNGSQQPTQSPRMLRICTALKIAPSATAVKTCMQAAVMPPGTMGDHTEGVRAWAARLIRQQQASAMDTSAATAAPNSGGLVDLAHPQRLPRGGNPCQLLLGSGPSDPGGSCNSCA